jgi:cysteine desulfurase
MDRQKQKVYLDYAATTPVKPEVVTAMLPYFMQTVGGSEQIDEASRTFEKLIGAEPGTVRFNSGGSYGNNEIIKSFSHSNFKKGKHLITSQIEHPSVYKVFEQLATEGFDITYIKVDAQGVVDLNQLKAALREDTILVSVMLMNNELGCRQPVEAIGQICREKHILFHIDAVQALGNEWIDVKSIGCDAMSFSSHKVYAPKGCGAIYVRDGLSIDRLISQCDYRADANTPYIVGFMKGLELAYATLDASNAQKRKLRSKLIKGLEQLQLGIKHNGPPEEDHHHPGIANFYYPMMDGDSLVINYDFAGFAISSGSACSSGALSASHVLKAIGLTENESKKCVRITIGDFTSEADIDGFLSATVRILKGK